MRPEPFTEVEIVRDDPAQQVRAGQRGYLLDWLPHPQGGEPGAVVELHDRPDDPVITVPESCVRAVTDVSGQAKSKKRAG